MTSMIIFLCSDVSAHGGAQNCEYGRTVGGYRHAFFFLSCKKDDCVQMQKGSWQMGRERNARHIYGFRRKLASVGRGQTGMDTVSGGLAFPVILIFFLLESVSCFSKTEGFGERKLFPFTGHQSCRTDEKRARYTYTYALSHRLWIQLAILTNSDTYFISGNLRIMNLDAMEQHDYLTGKTARNSCH